ncbi:hypothetical protein PVAG01_02477 [Phlyctema vagabunda]|uniref:Uncharacterized protein n=1 Tax=Phlyctema vagabunda TaxID=108571 RepID=A0ABR4PQR0_9HELO
MSRDLPVGVSGYRHRMPVMYGAQDPPEVSVSSTEEMTSLDGHVSMEVLNREYIRASSHLDLQSLAAKLKDSNSQCILFQTSPEVLAMILELACHVGHVIRPIQIAPRSNKFFLSPRPDHMVLPAALQLALTCKRMYIQVALGDVFYQANHFNLTSRTIWDGITPAITYLAAITPRAVNSITSIECNWPAKSSQAAALFTALAACEGLRSLTLTLEYAKKYLKNPNNEKNPVIHFSQLKEFKLLLHAVRGLKKFEFRVFMESDTGQNPMDITMSPLFIEQLKKPREPNSIPRSKIEDIFASAPLDIVGSGRITNERNPNLVSSRTRSAADRANRITSEGVLAKELIPMFDPVGNLNWYIENIKECRALVDREEAGIAFMLQCVPTASDANSLNRYQVSRTMFVDFEKLDHLDPHVQHEIYLFYKKNPTTLGLQFIIDTWVYMRGFDNAHLTHLEKGIYLLESIVVRNERREKSRERRKAALAAAREARKAAQQAEQN